MHWSLNYRFICRAFTGCLIEEAVAGHIIFYNYWQFDLFQFTYTCEASLICPSIWFGSDHLPSEKASNLKPIICISIDPLLNNQFHEKDWIKFPAPIQDLRKCCHSSDSKIVDVRHSCMQGRSKWMGSQFCWGCQKWQLVSQRVTKVHFYMSLCALRI